MKKGFTLVEMLISLTVIAILATLTIPGITLNVKEKAWEAQSKSLHAKLIQAITPMPAIAGFGSKLTEEEQKQDAAEYFVVNGLQKIYKFKRVCSSNTDGNTDESAKCKFPVTFKNFTGNGTVSLPGTYKALLNNANNMPETKPAYFITANGESAAVFYNPNCKTKAAAGNNLKDALCANIIYDTNGEKAPNQMGKDMGIISVFYARNPMIVAPQPTKDSVTELSEDGDIAAICRNKNGVTANLEEVASLMANAGFININGIATDEYVTGTPNAFSKDDSNNINGATYKTLTEMTIGDPSNSGNVICIEK